jgi:phage repressor protein C with HTH and peptisase S24 domain
MAPKKKHAIGARVALRRGELGISQPKLAAAIGMKQQGILSIERGDVERPRKLRELSRALRTSDEWLLTGKGQKVVDSDDDRAVPAEFDDYTVPSGIQEIDVRAGMGGGGNLEGRAVRHMGDHSDPVKPEGWHFPRSFVREELRTSESRIIIVETQGDSMMPTIHPGERVVVDTGHITPSPDGVYAIRDHFDQIQVKRLQVMSRGEPPSVLIISDNPAHKVDEENLEELQTRIIGRVICCMRRV